MSLNPTFSIVTVTLNPGADLAVTAKSVDCQSFTAYEHIVKDGGTTDGSLDLLPQSPRRKVLTMKDTGIYDAMNQALAQCTGSYILFLNAGDALAGPQILEAVAQSVSRNPVDLIYCDFVNGEFEQQVVTPARLTPFYVFRTNLCHQVCFYSKRCFEHGRDFDTSFRIAADHDFLARITTEMKDFRATHLALTGIRYKGAGFSRRADQQRKHLQELSRIRRCNFPPITRAFFSVALAATFPRLRNAIYDVRALRPIVRPYTWVVNAVRMRGSATRERTKVDAPH
jgi:glycosyltransferase involved in cell wall biosynthesis